MKITRFYTPGKRSSLSLARRPAPLCKKSERCIRIKTSRKGELFWPLERIFPEDPINVRLEKKMHKKSKRNICFPNTTWQETIINNWHVDRFKIADYIKVTDEQFLHYRTQETYWIQNNTCRNMFTSLFISHSPAVSPADGGAQTNCL